ncbi:hypothetical protein F5X99DRAFT_243804 [Biscogniauxia marginata]|nr:hypothetical protein F5X99DRAFT_243804 [Biscogniauxia marginata]
MADQCIVCLEGLDIQAASPPQVDDLQALSNESNKSPANATASPSPKSSKSPLRTTTDVPTCDDDNNNIAVIQVCGHVLHDACLREWTGKANSCPICRQAFHLVTVYDKIGGAEIHSYKVEDKKQVAEFDPQAWLDENPEEESDEVRTCPICNRADHEDLLLLCDSCDAPYHTYCVGLDSVPRGHWFCLECSETAAGLLADELYDSDIVIGGLAGFSDGQSDYLPRTQASMRRARQRARSDEWQGAWGQITGHVWDALNIDLDNHDDDEALRNYRRSQQRRERERREYQRWQQRLNIASRLGARDVFANNFPNVLPQRVVQPTPPPPQETPEEKQAWGALEKAMEVEAPEQSNSNHRSSNHRKRKSRSVTASPVEPPQQPERKLKRPRTRRVPTHAEASSSRSAARAESSSSAVTVPQLQPSGAPSFLSSLLKEVETSTSPEDENARALFFTSKPAADPSSPIASPSPSAHSSPRALSTTPPPRGINDRPGSPLSLSSRIEPIYPPANYVTNRSGGDHSDSESSPRQHQPNGASRSPEIRQPRPRRQHSTSINTTNLSVSGPGHIGDTSPTRVTLPFEMKESISGIVKDALKPHWKSGHITADQYASINRDLSHKLYKEVSESTLNNEDRNRFERIANKEVARAVADLKA